jgi:hypothetical protein
MAMAVWLPYPEIREMPGGITELRPVYAIKILP